MNTIDRARTSFDKGIMFDINSLPVDPKSPLPEDGMGHTNCINFISWVFGIDIRGIEPPRIDYLYNNTPQAKLLVPGTVILYPSRTFDVNVDGIITQHTEPGCIALMSDKPGNIILAHPTLNGIGETSLIESRIFSNKPFHFITLP